MNIENFIRNLSVYVVDVWFLHVSCERNSSTMIDVTTSRNKIPATMETAFNVPTASSDIEAVAWLVGHMTVPRFHERRDKYTTEYKSTR